MTKKLIRTVVARNMVTANGTVVPNQILMTIPGECTIFQSYGSTIAINYGGGKIELGSDWDYSTTTGKYRNQFLDESKKETQAKIDSGVYVVRSDI